MTECRTVSVSIQRPPDRVYDYLADPARFPEWSAFITKIEPDGSAWRATTPLGTLRLQFEPRNTYRILDHTVTTADGSRVHIPMRVVPNGADGSEVMLPVFREPGMTDEQYVADLALARSDLACLKRVLET
jgi:uncharacterized membrane protein